MATEQQLSTKHILGIKYLTEGDIRLIFETARSFKEVLNRPIKIARSEQTCALGAAMFAATAAGIYDNVSDAMARMGSGFDAEYHPSPEQAAIYEKIYQEYNEAGRLAESFFGK